MTLHKPLYWKLIILFKYMNFQNVYKITIRLLLRKNVHSTKIIIPWNRLPVSDLACKELKSCRLVLTTSIELGGKNEEPFSDLSENWGLRTKYAPKIGDTDRHIQVIRAYRNRNPCWNQGRGRETWIVSDRLLEAQRGQVLRVYDSRGAQYRGSPCTVLSSTPRVLLGSHGDREKNSLDPPAEGGGRVQPEQIHREHSVLLSKTCP